MRFSSILSLLSAFFLTGLPVSSIAAETSATIGSPYGICAHLNRWEYDRMPQELELIRQAGIRHVRTDLDWNQIEPEKGKWNFERWDALVKEAEKRDITLLPILGGSQPRWGSPLVKHMDDWKTYLETVLSRYPALPCWEVVNEPNLNEFSRAEAYVPLLKESYRTIKRIHPGANVTTGGMGDIPLPYLERMLKSGASGSFDIMNVHPYYWKGLPESSLAWELQELRKQMRKYGSEKPVWITETGYATASGRNMTGITHAALRKLNLHRDSTPVVLICDDDFHYYSEGRNIHRLAFFSPNRKFREITLKELGKLDPGTSPLLMLSVTEGFPMAFAKELLGYVKNGGTVFIPGGGIPMYYNYRRQNGAVLRDSAADSILKQFHIAWDAWWVNPKAPKGTSLQETAPGFGKLSYPGSAGRFLSDRNLKPGDRLIPIVTASSKDRTYSAPVAGIYQFNSDLKGNFLIYTWTEYADSVSKETQAELLPRTFLIALSCGVEKVFWYNFRSRGSSPNSREHHFGIVERDLTPKPAYHAYKTLTEMCPAESTRPLLTKRGTLYRASWTRPDGGKSYALWRIRGTGPEQLRIRGNLKEIRNHLGKVQSWKGGPLPISDAVTYLSGDRTLSVDFR